MTATRPYPYGSVRTSVPVVCGLKLIITAATHKVITDGLASVAQPRF